MAQTIQITDVQPQLSYPDPIDRTRVDLLVNKGIDPKIAALDLEMVKMKLQEPDEGLGWNSEQCDNAEIEYKRYLHLCLKHGKGIVPNKIMDYMWHYHILDTRAYHVDCEEVFGGYFHHYPYFGMRGESDLQDLKDSFVRTQELYLEAFGEDMARSEEMKCWHDCESRCWNACKS